MDKHDRLSFRVRESGHVRVLWSWQGTVRDFRKVLKLQREGRLEPNGQNATLH